MPSSRASEEEEHRCASAPTAGAKGHLPCLRTMSREALLQKDEAGETAAHGAARGKHTAALRLFTFSLLLTLVSSAIKKYGTHAQKIPEIADRGICNSDRGETKRHFNRMKVCFHAIVWLGWGMWRFCHEIVFQLITYRYLCETVPVIREIPSQLGELPAHISVAMGDEESCEILLAGPLREVLSMAMQRDTNGTSLLMAAVARGDNGLSVKLLKRFGKALATLPNTANMLPIHVAAAQGNLEMLKVLVKFDSQMVNARDEFGCTPTVYAAQAGCVSSLKILIDSARSQIGVVNSRGQSLLHVASLCGHEHVVGWLLERMCQDSIFWKTADEATVAHCAAYCGSSPVLRLLLSPLSSKKRRQLMAAKDSRGNTPIILAAMGNHVNAALFMVENGADIETVNSSGHSALGIASLRGYQELFSRLSSTKGINGKKDKGRRQSASSSTSVLSPRPALSPVSQPMRPYSSFTSQPSPVPLLTMSPKLSSGYSSGAEENIQVERHRMNYVNDGKTRDFAGQTDVDELSERVKVLDDALWAGLGLSAVEQIDRVLDEVEELRLSPSL